MRLADLYQDAIRGLRAAGIESPHVDAALLIEHCFGLSRSQLLLAPELEVDQAGFALFQQALRRRLGREPLCYITGSREFWSLDFLVSSAVLIPRPETEFLLTHVFTVLRKNNYPGERLLDMCTGSGVIAVVLAKEFSGSTVVAVDQSSAALLIAERNLEKHRVEKQVSLLCADLFSAFLPASQFDLMVSNPPYVATRDLSSLQPEVLDFEPHQALFAGERGLDIIARIAGEAPRYLKPGGWLFLEIGADQGEVVRQLFSQSSGQINPYRNVDIIDDWTGRPRVLQARLHC